MSWIDHYYAACPPDQLDGSVGCFGRRTLVGAHWDWCHHAVAKQAAQALGEALLGVCWGMSCDVLQDGFPGGPERQRMARWSIGTGWRYNGGAVLWLLDQARPEGCRAPWEAA